MIPLSRHFKAKRKTLFIMGGVVVLLLIAGGYLWWSASSWSNYHATYRAWKSETKATLDTVLSLPSDTAKERTVKLVKLESVSGGISSQASLCTPAGAVAWQQRINSEYDQWQKDCQKVLISVASVNDTLKKVIAYTRSDHQLAVVLTAALEVTEKKVTEKSFSSVQEKWEAAAAAVRDIKASEEFLSVKVRAQTAIDGVEAAWRALIAAHKAKDESSYEKATRQLSSAYTALESIKKESDTQTLRLGISLKNTYDAAF